MCLEGSAPGGTGVGKEDVDVGGGLCDLGGEAVDLGYLGDVGGHGDGFGAGADVREGVESGHGFLAGFGFAGGDIDFRAAGLEKTATVVRTEG